MSDPFNPKLTWKVGLIASNGKYLTTDTFGDRINATGVDMKKKQIFTVDPHGDSVLLIAPNNKFVEAGQKGELKAALTTSNADCVWNIEALDDGRWAFKSKYGYYLGYKDKEEEVHSFGRACDADTEKWTVHLAVHPQVCIRNNNRSSYMHLENGVLNVNEVIPWGNDALINIGYHKGKYSLQASNGKYLKHTGDLVDAVSEDTVYVLVINGDNVAFKATNGKYLQSTGSAGKVFAKSSEITKNELFSLEDSHPQVTLVNAGKLVTWKQGNDVKAIVAENEKTDTEIWQMEIDRAAANGQGRWSLRNNKGGYLTIKEGLMFTSETQTRDENSWLEVEWLGSQVAFKAHNGKYVSRQPNGSLKAMAGAVDDTCKFIFNLDNRPQLVMRSEFGYCGVKNVQSKNLIQCNVPSGEVFELEVKDGQYALKAGGAYAKLESDGSVSMSGGSPEWFYIELLVHTKIAVKAAATGKYITAEQTGGFKASANKVEGLNQLWEY